MHFSILIPHWKTGRMTAYAIAQFLKYKGKHQIDIIVIDNNAGDGSTKYLIPFMEWITIIDYPKDILQSHGIAFDYVLPHIRTDYFIAAESDSYPTSDNWLDYYAKFVESGVDLAGSLLELSGGTYVHPCGAMYKTSLWIEAKKYCDQIEYDYFPNMSLKDGFECHTMIHKSVVDQVLFAPQEYMHLGSGYKPFSPLVAQCKRVYYEPTVGPFHNGMGDNDESIKTYGRRNILSETSRTILTNKKKIIRRVGYEPGQWLTYFAFAMQKNVVFIPTETKWINDEPGTQQEYTLMENGFKHIWGVSAWSETDPTVSEYARIKRPIPENLYNTLPEHQKIEV